MRAPGFTAEQGLNRTAKVWSAGVGEPASRNSEAVVPQFCFQHEGGLITCADCVVYNGNDYCWFHSFRIQTAM